MFNLLQKIGFIVGGKLALIKLTQYDLTSAFVIDTYPFY